MDKLYELKDRLCKELEQYAGRELSSGSLDVVHKLSGAAKNLGKLIQMCEEAEDGYSGRSYANRIGVEPGRDMRSYESGASYRRRRDSMGRYSREGGYSRHGDAAERLRDMMDDAPTEQLRRELDRIARQMEQA